MRKFCILVPVYNAEKHLDKCINSVLAQTYSNFELVLVDDGSNDNSGQICDLYAEQNNKIHVIHQKNAGSFMARETAEKYVIENFSLDNSFIVYLDADDYLHRETLQILTETINNYHCDMIIYNLQRVTDQGSIISSMDDSGLTEIIVEKRKLFKRVLFNSSFNSLCRKAVSIDLLTKKPLNINCKMHLAEDLLSSLDYYKYCQKVVFLSRVLYNYVMNPNSKTHDSTYDGFEDITIVRKAVYDFIKEQEVFSSKDIEDYFIYLQDLLKIEIIKICCLNMDFDKKVVLFNRFLEEDIWKQTIQTPTKKAKMRIFIWLLNNRKYRLLILLTKMYFLDNDLENKVINMLQRK